MIFYLEIEKKRKKVLFQTVNGVGGVDFVIIRVDIITLALT